MKVSDVYSFLRSVCLACLVSIGQSALAQDAESFPANTADTLVQEMPSVPSPKPLVLIFGRVYSSKILAAMPQYKAMQDNLQAMKAQYEAEARKSEGDFQRKFEEFMQGKSEYPKTILEKRQNELLSMLETNAAFRLKVQALLQEAEKSMLADVKAEMNEAISVVAKEREISLVFDLDDGSVPYLLPNLAMDLTTAVIEYLNVDVSDL